MTKNFPISFIIPCYNCEKTLNDTVRSILNLKLPECEICMVDDGSKDHTYKMLWAYAKKYPEKIKIGKNPENRGGAYTRNECVKLSQYEWLFMIDADNYLDKKSFYKLLLSVTEDDNLITFQKIYFFYDFLGLDLVYRKWLFLKDKMIFDDLRRTGRHPVASGNYLLRRLVFDKINGYDADNRNVNLDSWSFGYRALLNGYVLKIVKDTDYFHRIDGKSYFIRNIKNFSNNLKNLLLKNPEKFSPEEIQEIKNSKNTQETLITMPNDFSIEKTGLFYKVLLKIYYKIKH